MKNSIIIIFTLIIFTAISCKNNKKPDEYFDNGNVKIKYISLSKKDTLSYIKNTFYLNGDIHIVEKYINGKREGDYIDYYNTDSTNGKQIIQQTRYYKNGMGTCLKKNFSKSGALKRELLYINDTIRAIVDYYKHKTSKYTKKEYKLFNIKDSLAYLYNVVISDTLGNVVEDNKGYCTCKDTINFNEKYCFDYYMYRLKPSITVNFYIGNIKFVEDNMVTVLIDTLYSSTHTPNKENMLSIHCCIDNRKKGYNLILGKIQFVINDTVDNINDTLEYPFFTDFYVE